MDRIEVIGASYVGKSTLLKAFEANNTSVDFITENQLQQMIINRNMLCYFKRKLIAIIVNRIFKGFYTVFKYPLIEEVLKKDLSLYTQTLSLCFQESILSLKDITFSSSVYNRIILKIRNLQYYESFDYCKALIVEESIVHWHLVLQELLLNTDYKLNSDIKRDKGLFPKALIYCYTDEKTILERIKLRKMNNLINKNHIDKDERVILSEVLSKQKFFKDYSSIVLNNGGNVLFLDTSNKLSDNVLKINNFLDTL